MTKAWVMGGLMALAAGCGGGKIGGVVAVVDGGETTTDDLRSATKVDASTPTDASTPGPSKFGDILLNADTYGSFADTSILGFFDVTQPSTADAGTSGCTFSTVGACSVVLCTGTPSGGGPAPVPESAGTLTVTGDKTYAVVPTAMFDYSLDDTVAGWAPGGTITVSAAGSTVPAFLTTVTAPAVVKIGAPTLSTSGAAPVFSRSSNLGLAWTGGTGAQLSMSLFNAAGTASLTCTFDAGTGSASIPSSALSMLPASTGYSFYGSTASDAANATVTVKDWTVSVSVYANAQSSAGEPYNETVTLQ
ncbi:MAG: hypothetical protein ABI321_08955 [Polyangia bacterium]